MHLDLPVVLRGANPWPTTKTGLSSGRQQGTQRLQAAVRVDTEWRAAWRDVAIAICDSGNPDASVSKSTVAGTLFLKAARGPVQKQKLAEPLPGCAWISQGGRGFHCGELLAAWPRSPIAGASLST